MGKEQVLSGSPTKGQRAETMAHFSKEDTAHYSIQSTPIIDDRKTADLCQQIIKALD